MAVDADRVWGGKPGAAAKAQAAMEQHYPGSKGMKVFAAKTVQREKDQAGVLGAIRAARRNTK